MEITLGKEHRTWYLNLWAASMEILKKIGYGKLFNEENGAK